MLESDRWVDEGMMGDKNVIAFQAGEQDAYEVVGEGNATAEQIEGWFAPGAILPDARMISALSTVDLARSLGLTTEEVSKRGGDWDAALEAYNDGYRTAARRAAAERSGRTRRIP